MRVRSKFCSVPQHLLLVFKGLPELYNLGRMSQDLPFSENVSKYVGKGYMKQVDSMFFCCAHNF